jgi:hypothetical protein
LAISSGFALVVLPRQTYPTVHFWQLFIPIEEYYPASHVVQEESMSKFLGSLDPKDPLGHCDSFIDLVGQYVPLAHLKY